MGCDLQLIREHFHPHATGCAKKKGARKQDVGCHPAKNRSKAFLQRSCLLSICWFCWGPGGSLVHTGCDDVEGGPGEGRQWDGGRVKRVGGWLETCWLACGPISDSKHSATFPFPPNAPKSRACHCFQKPVTDSNTQQWKSSPPLVTGTAKDGNYKRFSQE